MTETPPKELGFKKSSKIISYIKQFSATEKAIYIIFIITALVTTILMTGKINSYFMVQVPTYGGELHEGMIGLPRNINPVLAINDTDRDISSLIYSGLMKWSKGELTTDLAKSYKLSDDGLTYTFTLRDDAHFQDGTLLTTDDIVFTIQKIQDATLKSPRKSDWSNVIVQATSPNEIRFILKQAYSPFLTNTTLGILPKHIWNTINDDQFIFSHYNVEPIGSGPYKVSGITYDSMGIPTDFKLSTWSGYYGKKPYLSNILFSFYADEDKALTALDNGTITSLATVSATEALKLASNKAQPYTVLQSSLPRIFGVFFNQNQAPVLADKIVRQALDMSIDRKAIMDAVLSGYGVPLDGPLPSNIETEDRKPTAVIDIAGAKSLLEKNGWKIATSSGIYSKKNTKGVVQTISFDIYTADTTDLKQAAQMVKDSWTKMGAQVNLRVFNASDLYQNVIRTRKYDALLFGELIGKDQDLYAFWHSSQIKAPGLNIALYTNSKVDKLLEDIRTTNDDLSRTMKYSQFNDNISTDIPASFLYSPNFIYIVPKELKNIKLQDITIPADRWNSVSEWYISTANIWSIFATNK